MATTLQQSFKALLLAGAGMTIMTPAAFAQSAVLDEIVVTATKRTETVREIPMSIEAVSGDFIEDQSISNFEDLSQTIPNFSVGEGITTSQIVMRGLGSGSNRGFEQSVAMFVDGVYKPRSRQYVAPFFDVERVEVLRGPQAVLFGLNATAGSISVVSAKTMPGDETFVELGAEYEAEYGEKSGSVVAGVATDHIGLRLAYQNRGGGGFFENTFTGRDEGAVTSHVYKGTAVLQPTETFTMTAMIDHVNYKQGGTIGEIFGPGGTTFDPGDGILDRRRSTDAGVLHLMFDRPAGQYIDSTNYSLDSELDVGFGTFNLLLARSEFDFQLGVDLDNTSTNLGFGLDSSLEEDYRQSSAELRFTSPEDDKFEYVLGGYYQSTDNDQLNPAVFELAPMAALGIFQFNEAVMDSNLWSLFGIATYHLNDQFRITGGARYSDEDKSYNGGASGGAGCTLISGGVNTGVSIFTNPGLGPLCPTPPPNTGSRQAKDRSSTNFMPEVSLQYDATDDIMIYGKIGGSAKAGGFTTNGDTYDDESVTGYELGMKSRLADGAAELNLTVFRNDFSDLQVAAFTNDNPPVSFIGNAASAKSQGIEVDGRWAANDWLTLNGSMAYLDAKYKDFPGGPCPVGATSPCDLSDETLPFAAKWSGHIGAQFDFPISDDLTLVGGPNLSFSSKYFTDSALNAPGLQDGWTKIGARLGVESDRWSVAVVGKNLSDEVILNTSQPLAGRFLGYVSDPRTITLQAKIKFGG